MLLRSASSLLASSGFRYEHTDRRSQLGWRHGDGADAVRLPEAAPSRLPDRRAGARMEPADSRAHAGSTPGPELSARAWRAGSGDAAQGGAGPAWPVRAGDPAAQLVEVRAGAVLCRYPQAHGLARRDALRSAQRHAQAGQAA